MSDGIVDIPIEPESRAALHWKRFFDLSLDLFFVATYDGRALHANPAFEQVSGFTPEEVLARPYIEFIHPEDRAATIAEIAAVSRGTASRNFVNRCLRADGNYNWISWGATAAPDGDCFYAVGRDISEQKRLAEWEIGFGRVLEESLHEIYIFDAESLKFIQVNRGARENLGFTIRELRQLTPVDIKPRLTAAEFDDLVRPLRTGERDRLEFRTVHRRKDRSEYPVAVQLQLSQLGTTPAFVAMIQDTTQRDREESLQRDRNRLLERLAAGAPLREVLGLLVRMSERALPEFLASVLVLDRETNRLRHVAAPSLPDFYNAAIDGIAAGEDVGSCGTAAFTARRVITEDVAHDSKWTDYSELALRAGLRSCWSEPIIASDGRVLGTFALYSRSPRRPESSHLGFMRRKAQMAALAIERTDSERELVEAKELAVAANRSKSEFLANMSHEIRTPLTAILGYADILRQNCRSPDNRDAAETIERNGRFLLEILNDILDLSKIEAGRMQVERMPLSPLKLIDDVVALMRINAESKGLTFEVDCSEQVPAAIEGDPTRFRQILFNLVGNAVKFTEQGSVRLEADIAGDDRRTPRLRIDVVDTGIGLSTDQLALLFRPFSQADASSTRRFGGSGLGLTISKRLAEMMGGTITVESEPGRGSKFTLWLDVVTPAADAPAGSDGASHGPEQRRRGKVPSTRLAGRVLLVEDGLDNQRLISYLLRKAGAEVEVADNGRDALAAVLGAPDARTVPDERRFDVILMDMQMPVVDGYEATLRLRALGYEGPIIALTAHAMTDDRRKCLAVGCDDYLSKPIDRAMLLETVARHAAEVSQG